MGNKRIQDLPAKGTTIAANDILELSEYQSPGVYISKKILGSELGGVSTFTALTDTPASYTGQTLKFVRVNAGETALEFATVSVSDTNIANTQLTLPTGTRKLLFGGAASTDILAFRDWTDTQSLFEIRGNGDIFIGYGANSGGFVGGSGGSQIIAIGREARGGQFGISIGDKAGKNQNVGDYRNVYIGQGVAQIGTNVTANNNVGIGAEVFYTITTGSKNVAVGTSNFSEGAGFSISTGSRNVLIGNAAGHQITTGNDNTNLGQSSGKNNITGGYNTQVGATVYQGVGVNKSYNTNIGYNIKTSHNGTIILGNNTDTAFPCESITDDSAQFHFRSASQSLFFNKNTNLVLNSQVNLVAGTHFEVAATNTQTVHNGTAPVTNIANAYQQYSADITAGNAAPHFRTEAGDVIKLYKQASAGITTVGDLVTVLTNLGLLG